MKKIESQIELIKIIVHERIRLIKNANPYIWTSAQETQVVLMLEEILQVVRGEP